MEKKTKSEIRSMFINLMVECEKHLDGKTTEMQVHFEPNFLCLSFGWQNPIRVSKVDSKILRSRREHEGRNGWAVAAGKELGMEPNAVRVRHHRLKTKSNESA